MDADTDTSTDIGAETPAEKPAEAGAGLDAGFAELLSRHLRYLGSAPLTGDARLRDLGLDSMQAINLLFAIEDAYGVSIPDELLVDETFETGGNLWSVVVRLREGDRR
ncbi:phosphopantetheine-binding protein [Actinomadura syzygii]|uniref:phosphopantetheine-binding protein n=1 Tax=Actinomadura syzygii TaxID=1427538 RepID=UPI001CA36671|nr:phosphopantetheine-binding protein [Actinomadura syzygii]